MKARPTEYKGVRYRSKSEAMFARFLELELDERRYMGSHKGPWFNNGLNNGASGFIYEPESLEVDGWKPDFLVHQTWERIVQGYSLPVTDYQIIEYKPSKPTRTYAEEFALRCAVLFEKFSDRDMWWFSRRCSCVIYWGSVFNECRGLVSIEGLEVEFDGDHDWISDFEEEIKATRFDLEMEVAV
jgi:hypothetical protein